MSFGRGFGGDILIEDVFSHEKYDYDNYKGEAVVFFDLVRDRSIGKFPVLQITFWNEFGHFIGHVVNDEYNIQETYSIYFNQRNCTWQRECFFNLNEHENPAWVNTNLVTVKIFTSKLTFPME